MVKRSDKEITITATDTEFKIAGVVLMVASEMLQMTSEERKICVSISHAMTNADDKNTPNMTQQAGASIGGVGAERSILGRYR